MKHMALDAGVVEQIVLDDDSPLPGDTADPETALNPRRLARDAAFRALADAHQETLFRLALMTEARRGGDPARIVRVAALAGLIAETLGWSERACEQLSRAAPLADVGLCMVEPAGGAGQPTRTAAYREHPRHGARLLGGTEVPVLQMAAVIALGHHERWDGRGYPSCLAGEATPLEARIVAVAEYFDTLTLGPVAQRLSDARAREALEAERGRRFDPRVVDAVLANASRLCGLRDFVNAQGAGEGFDWPPAWWRVF